MSDFTVVQKANFDGTVIITDPCYVISNSVWDSGEIVLATGEGIEKLGITDYIWGGTVYGDWSCTLKEVDRLPEDYQDEIEVLSTMGGFCADAGLVGVFYLDSVMHANPGLTAKVIDFFVANGLAVVINDFEGEITLSDYDDNRHIMGKGKNENRDDIAFFSHQ